MVKYWRIQIVKTECKCNLCTVKTKSVQGFHQCTDRKDICSISLAYLPPFELVFTPLTISLVQKLNTLPTSENTRHKFTKPTNHYIALHTPPIECIRWHFIGLCILKIISCGRVYPGSHKRALTLSAIYSMQLHVYAMTYWEPCLDLDNN